MANPQVAVPLLLMIGQAQLSIENLLGRTYRQFVEQLLIMAAVSVTGPRRPVRSAGKAHWHGSQGDSINLGTSKLKVNRLGVTGELARCLSTTNVIESPNSVVRRVGRRVTNYRDVKMALR